MIVVGMRIQRGGLGRSRYKLGVRASDCSFVVSEDILRVERENVWLPRS